MKTTLPLVTLVSLFVSLQLNAMASDTPNNETQFVHCSTTLTLSENRVIDGAIDFERGSTKSQSYEIKSPGSSEVLFRIYFDNRYPDIPTVSLDDETHQSSAFTTLNCKAIEDTSIIKDAGNVSIAKWPYPQLSVGCVVAKKSVVWEAPHNGRTH